MPPPAVAGRMPARTLLALLALAAIAGCLAEAAEDAAPLASASAPAPGDAAPPAGEVEATRADYRGYISFILLGWYNPTDPVVFPADLPEGYVDAVATMTWTPTSPEDPELSLMIHEKGAMGADGMVAEAIGRSPLELRVDPANLTAGAYDLVVYVPLDGRSKAVVHQPFEIEWVVRAPAAT